MVGGGDTAKAALDSTDLGNLCEFRVKLSNMVARLEAHGSRNKAVSS